MHPQPRMNVLVDHALAADRRANKVINKQSEKVQRQEALSKIEDDFDSMRADGLDDQEVQTLLAQLENLGMDTTAIRSAQANGKDVEKQFQRSVDRFGSALAPTATEELELQRAVYASNSAWAAATDASHQNHKLLMNMIGNLKA